MISRLKITIILLSAFILMPMTALAENGTELTELLGVKIGKTVTLRDIQRRLGMVQIVETGEAGEYKAAVCYYVPACKTKVEFWSSELGGPEHNVIGFTLTQASVQGDTCLKLDLNKCEDVLRLENGISLGMPLDQFEKRLNGGLKAVGVFYQKAYESKQPMTEKERARISKSLSSSLPNGLDWDIVVFIRGAFDERGLKILEVTKTQTF